MVVVRGERFVGDEGGEGDVVWLVDAGDLELVLVEGELELVGVVGGDFVDGVLEELVELWFGAEVEDGGGEAA